MTPERIARLRQVLALRQPDLTVITDFVHKQRNLSAIVRNCDAVGIMSLEAVIGDEDYKAFRGTAMGSHHWVEVVRHSSLETAVLPLKARGYQVVAAHLSPEAVAYPEVDYTVPTAILLGAERRGVSAAAEALVDTCVTIPMVGMVGSLNVSVASGILLAEAQRQRSLAGMYQRQRISEAQFQRLFFEWGHPEVAEFCRERGLSYPALNAEGEIAAPADWYASVRAGTAPVLEGKL
jgi:tRNA (guanosine-2'-O-)-methyltransferase